MIETRASLDDIDEVTIKKHLRKADEAGFIVTLFKDKFSEEQLQQLGLNDRQADALLFYKNKKEVTGLEYAERYKIAERTARADLAELVEKQILVKKGETKAVKYTFTAE